MTTQQPKVRASKSTITLSFPLTKEQLRKIEVSDDDSSYTIYRLLPRASEWPAADVPDGPNPRSHEQASLESGSTKTVAKAIRKTLLDHPEDFSLANRGGCLIAESLKFDPVRNRVTIILSDLDNHGLADGATSNAVIAQVQTMIKDAEDSDECEQWEEALIRARFNVEVIVGLSEQDHERVVRLVRGRNTSVQVRPWSLADFDHKFDWIKDLIDREGGDFAGRIGWEENAGTDISILDVVSIMTLFHPIYDDPKERRRRSPTSAFSGKGTNDRRLLDEKMAPGYKKLAGVLEDILRLHDYVYKNFEPMYQSYKKEFHNKGGRLGKRSGAVNKETLLPLTGEISEYKIEKGLIFPLLYSLRCLLTFRGEYAEWLTDPCEFFDDYGVDLMGALFEQYEVCRSNPATTGKTKAVYTYLHMQAKELLREKEAADALATS